MQAVASWYHATVTIGIDCRFAHTQTGLGRYTREIVRELISLPSSDRFVLFVSPLARIWISSLSRERCIFVETDIPHYSIREQLSFPALIRRAQIDLLFSPHFNVPFRCPVPFVATVHDLILHRYLNSASLPRRIGYRVLMSKAVSGARRIIAVSHFTSLELQQAYGERIAKKIIIVPEGVTPDFHPRLDAEQAAVVSKYGIRRPFFLYVGNAKQHKNVQTLIDALALLPSPAPSLVLVTNGKETAMLQTNSSVQFLTDVPDEDLPSLYSAATAFVTASLYEGFCLPVIEAAACGCRIIAPRSTAIKEVAPEGTLFAEPTPQGIAEAMQRTTHAPALTPYKEMTWQRAASRVQEVLHAALR